jgi:hypothetical protein
MICNTKGIMRMARKGTRPKALTTKLLNDGAAKAIPVKIKFKSYLLLEFPQVVRVSGLNFKKALNLSKLEVKNYT